MNMPPENEVTKKWKKECDDFNAIMRTAEKVIEKGKEREMEQMLMHTVMLKLRLEGYTGEEYK